MKKWASALSIAIFSFGIFHFIPTALAQVESTDATLILSPQYPSPNQNVTASITSNTFSLDTSDIAWFINGIKLAEGIGQKDYSFTTGQAGTQTSVEVKVTTQDGSMIDKVITINPVSVTMLWQADDSYVPPFYKGKSLVASEGSFRVVAMPNITIGGQEVDSHNLVYSWNLDNESQPDASGYGKNSFVFKNSYLDSSNTVSVTVSDTTGSVAGTGSITLQTGTPKIVFYEDDPTLGIQYQNALQNGFTLNPQGETLVAEPYFFSPADINSSDLSMNWSINGSPIGTPNQKNILSIKPDAGQSGQSAIDVAVKNIKTLFQNTDQVINVTF